ncbi:MAG: FAD binding domain-containing protein, partial [Sulfitobacter sp.]
MYNFDVEMPSTIADAVQALSRDEAQPLSGGQTLIPTLKARLAAPSVLVSLHGIAEMKGVSKDGATLSVGGGTTHATVAAEAAASYP